VGLTSDEISRITEGPNAPGWNPFDATLLRAVDELHSDAFITDTTWNALAKRYDEKQLMDLVMTVGDYNMVSMFLNTMGVQLEEGTVGFPKGKNK
jgi:alkylhydroperoxidase family enzyme